MKDLILLSLCQAFFMDFVKLKGWFGVLIIILVFFNWDASEIIF